MGFIADTICIRPRCSNQKIQRLHPRITGSLCHNIKEFSIRLGMQLVENDAVYIEAVLRISLGGQHLIEGVCRQV